MDLNKSQMGKYVVDTHALLWFLMGSSQLSDRAKSILEDANNQLIIPAIVLAEAIWITRHKKALAITSQAVMAAMNADSRIEIYPLNLAVIERTMKAEAIKEMHDRQIVSTVLVLQEAGEEVALVTCDRNIVESALVSTVW